MAKRGHSQLRFELVKGLNDAGLNHHFFLFTRITGQVKLHTGKGRYGSYRAGVNGQADVYLYGCGRAIEIELKSAKDRMRPEQKRWQKFCFENGIPHFILRETHFESDMETIKNCLLEIKKEWKK